MQALLSHGPWRGYQWFRNRNAALYVENSWDHADEFAQYFADEIAYRSGDGLAILNVDGSTEISCGWYFADKVDGKWLLSQYIAMDCAD